MENLIFVTIKKSQDILLPTKQRLLVIYRCKCHVGGFNCFSDSGIPPGLNVLLPPLSMARANAKFKLNPLAIYLLFSWLGYPPFCRNRLARWQSIKLYSNLKKVRKNCLARLAPDLSYIVFAGITFFKASFSSLLNSFPPFAILRIDAIAISGRLPEPNNRNCPAEDMAIYTAFNKDKARMGLEVKTFPRSRLKAGLA
jgi:hypothetical protein